MARTRVRLKSKGMVELLQSADFTDRMRRAQAAYARPSHIEVNIHGPRAVTQLVADDPKAIYREAHTGELARAFGAI